MDKLISQKQISQDGASFVRKCLDPFHDFEVRLNGLPDAFTGATVVQEVTRSKTISKSDILAAGKWDAHIAILPDLSTLPGLGFNINTDGNAQFMPYGNLTTEDPLGRAMGLVTISCNNTGQNTFTPSSLPIFDVFDFSEFFTGQKRLIGLAFEVHDTTAEIYRQGSVTCYRQPQTVNESFMGITGLSNLPLIPPVTGFVATQVITSRLPPQTPAQAMLLSGSRQWESAEGCYVVAVMDPTQCEMSGGRYAIRSYLNSDNYSVGAITDNPGMSTVPISVQRLDLPSTNIVSLAMNKPVHPTSMHTGGAYFSGLNDQTTLTITVRAIFESAPSYSNSQLVVLAQKSPDYDPLALELYKHAASSLPVGVPVGENASGDFWDKILTLISSAAPIVGSLAPFPGASIIGNLTAKAAAEIQKNRNASDRKQIVGNFNANGNKNAVAVKLKK